MADLKIKIHRARDVEGPAPLGPGEKPEDETAHGPQPHGPQPLGQEQQGPAIKRQAGQPGRTAAEESPSAMQQARALARSNAGSGTGSRARVMRSAQGVLGNVRAGQIAGAGAAGMEEAPAIQTKPKTPADPALAQVQSVRSLHIEEDLKPAVTGAEAQLKRRLKQREAAIKKELAAVSALEKQPWAKQKGDALRADLKKDLDAILKSADSKYVDRSLRKDIVEANDAVKAKQGAVAAAEVEWKQYDAAFADPAVVKTLGAKGFSPAELKALVAQESLDLTRKDNKGDIAGVAQMGSAEVKEVGGKPADRLDPKKAIPLSAKVLVHKADQLEKQLSQVPKGDDYKKFVYASYNAGAQTIVEAQNKAIAMGRDPKSWDALVQGGPSSPLFHGIKVALPKLDPAKKYKETTDYVARIGKRLP